MATDPSAALDELIAAFRDHLDAATTERDPDSDAVLDAAAVLADAFDAYDEVLYEVTGVDTPFYLDDSDEDEEDGDVFDEDDESEDDEDESEEP